MRQLCCFLSPSVHAPAAEENRTSLLYQAVPVAGGEQGKEKRCFTFRIWKEGQEQWFSRQGAQHGKPFPWARCPCPPLGAGVTSVG